MEVATSARQESRRWRRIWPIVIAILALGALAVMGKVFDVGAHVEPFLRWVQQQGVWGPVVIVGVYAVACVLMLPGVLLTVPVGYVFGVGVGVATVSVASVLGACAAFWVGRTVGRGWVQQKVAGNARFAAIDAAVGREGFKIVLLTRLSPIFPFNLQNFAYGLTTVGFWKYALASWIGMLPGTVLYVYLGSAARSLLDATSGDLAADWRVQVMFWAGLAIAVGVAVFVARVARRALKAVAINDGSDQSHGQTTKA